MKKNKASSTARLVFSTIAVVIFIFYMLFDKFIMSDSIYDSIYRYTYGWRADILNDIFLFFPFLMLFIFALMERKSESINERNYIVWIFALQLVQVLITLIGESTSQFSLFCSKEFDYLSIVVCGIVGIRVLMLFLTPFVKPIFLKGYCLGMISFLLLLLNSVIYGAKHWGDPLLENCIPLIPDLAFHIAFYFFSDLMTEENETSLKDLFLYGFLGVLDHLFSMDDDWDDFDDWDFENEDYLDHDSEEVKNGDQEINIDIAEQYDKIASYALVTENESFPEINHFFERLSRNVFTDEEGKYYSSETYVEKLSALKRLVEEMKKEEPEYISEQFVWLVDMLLVEKEEEVFKLKVVKIAREFMGREL